MGILETLVVGIDDSIASEQPLAWAADRSTADDSLQLVHAQRSEDLASDTVSRREGERLLADGSIRAGVLPGVRIETHLAVGNPTEALLRVAKRSGADAIVVGPHSAAHNIGGLGAVTRQLLQRAPLPIIVAKAETPDDSDSMIDSPSATEDRAVLACVGYGDATERAAMWAADYATEQGARLRLLHVVGYRPFYPADSPSDMLASYLGGGTLRRWAQEDLEEIRERVRSRHQDLVIEAIVETGAASRAIIAASDRAEIVVLGKRQDTAIRHFISPRIHRLIAQTRCSVAVIPSCADET